MLVVLPLDRRSAAAGHRESRPGFPHFITTHVPAGLAGLFLAALFGAAMANLSSDFNSLSAIGVEDYYRIWRPNSTTGSG